MKKIIHFLLTIGVLVGLGYVLRMGLQKQEADHADVQTDIQAASQTP